MDFQEIKVPHAEALQSLQKFRDEYPTSKKYPFFIRDADGLELLHENIESEPYDPSEKLQLARNYDINTWIEERRIEFAEFDIPDEDTLGEWPEDAQDPPQGLYSYYIESDQLDELYIGFAELEEPWQLPAIIGFGGFNDCPLPEVQSAFHRHWFEKYGAEITSMSGDIVECYVANPPTTPEAAMELAWEQFWYCQDIVGQGCETVSNLAATLLDSHYWFFWWD